MTRSITWSLLLALFALGAMHWVLFLNYGNIAFTRNDWAKEAAYYSILKDWTQSGVLPLHIDVPIQGTQRFFAIPETVLSPQILLLRYLSVGQFVVANTLIMYAIGFWGCLRIRRRYRLSLLPFAILFLLFHFNGHIVSHLAAGHSMWNGYFLLPFFTLCLLDLVGANDGNGSSRNRTALELALVLLAMNLQGSFHLYVWCLMLISLVAACNYGQLYARALMLAAGFSLATSTFRFLPGLLTYWSTERSDLAGYPTVADLIAAFVTIRSPLAGAVPSLGTGANWFEYDLFIGVIGLAFVGYWGLYAQFNQTISGTARRHRFAALDWPLAVMMTMSLGAFYGLIVRLPLPLFAAERVSSRFLIVPFVILLTIACIRFQDALAELSSRSAVRWLMVAATVQTGFELAAHSKAWRLAPLSHESTQLDASYRVIQVADPAYTGALVVSVAISGAALAVLAFWHWRAAKTPRLDV